MIEKIKLKLLLLYQSQSHVHIYLIQSIFDSPLCISKGGFSDSSKYCKKIKKVKMIY